MTGRTTFLLLLLLALTVADVSAQYRPKPSRDPFLKSQWWVGLRAGVNVTEAIPDQRYSSFSPINYEPIENEKVYDGYSKAGYQAGLEVTYFTRGISISFQPMFARQFYEYSSYFVWSDVDNPDNRLTQDFEIKNDLEYLDLPLIIKYDLMSGRIRPFIQIGGYYSLLLSAGKTINSSGTDTASGYSASFTGEEIKVGATDLYESGTAGVLGGVGAVFSQGNIRLIIDVNYRYGLTNITDPNNRYTNNQLASIGDVQDDITLRSIWVNIGAQFPLKFISKDYEAIN